MVKITEASTLNKILLTLFLFVVLSSFGKTISADSVFQFVRSNHTLSLKEVFKKEPAAVNCFNSRQYTPLILAAYKGNMNMVKFLLRNGADVNLKSNQGSALHGACYKGEYEIVQILLEKGANPNLADNTGLTPLIYPAMAANVKLATLLINKGADPTITDKSGRNALSYAKALNNVELINLFQKK